MGDQFIGDKDKDNKFRCISGYVSTNFNKLQLRFNKFLCIFLAIFFPACFLPVKFCLAAEPNKKNESGIREQRELLDKEEAVFGMRMVALNEEGNFLNKDKWQTKMRGKKAHYQMGYQYAQEGNIDRGKRAHYQMGYQYAQEGNIDSAIKEFELVIKYALFDKDAHYNLGCLYAKAERFEEAIKEYERALNLSSDREDGQIYYNLALIYDKNLKDPVKAREYYQKFLTVYQEQDLSAG